MSVVILQPNKHLSAHIFFKLNTTMESSIGSTSNAVTTFKVILTLFFTIQLEIVDYLSILQESADSFSQGQKLASVDTTFDYIIGETHEICMKCFNS